MPTLRQLEYLVALADIGHFGRAAQAKGVSQPTLSQQLRALEERFGTALVERCWGKVQLTPIGREIVARSRRLLVEVEDMIGLAHRAAHGAAGTVRFGVTPTLGPYLLPHVVAELHRDQPDLKLYIREGIPKNQLLQLSRGELDMLVAPLPLAGDDLTFEPLFREPLHLVAPADHPLAQAEQVTQSDLRGAAILSLDPRHHLHSSVEGLCSEWNMNLLRDYEGTSLDSIRQMVAFGLGLGILPELYLRSESGVAIGVTVLKVTDWSATRSIVACWRTNSALGEAYLNIARRIQARARFLLGLL